MTSDRRRIAGLAVASLGLVAAGDALAQSGPYHVGISQAFARESNVFRVAEGQPESSDTHSTTSLLAGIDESIGRQRVFANAVARYNRYRDNDQLNHSGYGVAAGVDWETIEALSGRLSYTANQNLARYGADQGPALTTKNLERSQEFLARARYGQVSLLSLEAIYTHRRLDYSARAFDFAEFEQDAVSLGLLYRPGGLLTLGVAARHTKGRYPYAVESPAGVFQRDDFRRNDADLTALWTATGQSTLRARLSYTKESHEALASRDVSGATGALGWDYTPTAKLSFKTELMRDTGAESSFSRSGEVVAGAVGNNSQLSRTLSIASRYEATAKVQFEARARYVKRDLVSSFALGSGAASTSAGTDALRELQLGVNYVPTRSVLVGCSVGHEKRTASSSVSYAYTAGVAGCLAQLKFQ